MSPYETIKTALVAKGVAPADIDARVRAALLPARDIVQASMLAAMAAGSGPAAAQKKAMDDLASWAKAQANA
jgi:hypothetical protein